MKELKQNMNELEVAAVLKPPFFGDHTYFIQMAPHTKVSVQRAESQDVAYDGAAPS